MTTNGNEKDKNQLYCKLKWTELMILICPVLVATIFILFYFNSWTNDVKVFQLTTSYHDEAISYEKNAAFYYRLPIEFNSFQWLPQSFYLTNITNNFSDPFLEFLSNLITWNLIEWNLY